MWEILDVTGTWKYNKLWGLMWKIVYLITQSQRPRILSIPYSVPTYTPATVPSCFLLYVRYFNIIYYFDHQFHQFIFFKRRLTDPSMHLPSTFSSTEKMNHSIYNQHKNIINNTTLNCFKYSFKVVYVLNLKVKRLNSSQEILTACSALPFEMLPEK